MNFDPLIGATPLVQAAPNLFLKIEYANRTGSVKDRAAREMVFCAKDQGLLRPGSTIIEPTSGNTGISLAAIAAREGYRCVIVMPDSVSIERRQLIRAYGGQVVLTPGVLGMQGAVEKAQELLTQIPGGWMADQFSNPANSQAHYRTTGPEIWQQTGGKVDVFVAGVGTGGTITGVARYLKEQNPAVRIVAVEPKESPLLSQGRAASHGIQGIGPNFVPQVLDRNLIDQIITVSEKQAMAAARSLAAEEGLFAGISSGAAFYAAKQLSLENPDKAVVTILPDSGSRYLSTALFSSTE